MGPGEVVKAAVWPTIFYVGPGVGPDEMSKAAACPPPPPHSTLARVWALVKWLKLPPAPPPPICYFGPDVGPGEVVKAAAWPSMFYASSGGGPCEVVKAGVWCRRRRRRANIKPVSGERLVFAGFCVDINSSTV